MQLTRKGKVFAVILVASAFFSITTVTFGFFPYFGLSLSLIVFTLLAYFIRKDKSSTTKFLLIIGLTLEIMLAIRSEGFLTFLNMAGIVYFGSMLILPEINLLAPAILILKSLLVTSNYNLEFKEAKSSEQKKEDAISAVTIFLTTLVILGAILPLLSSANPFFNKLVLDGLDFLGLRDLKITDNIVEWMIRVLVFLILAFIVPRMATVGNSKDSVHNFSIEGLNMLIPKISVAFVLTIFFVTQLQLYFSTPETLSSMGYTLSKYTNEVFGQLSAVAAIVLILLYGEKEKKGANNKTALVLVIQGVFLTLMAYKSDFDYINSWGFTYKRLYGLAVATWILGIFFIYLNTFLRGIPKSVFLIRSLIYTGIILIFINLANFDYLIYHYRRATTGEGVDREYLTRLSSDSLSFKDQLNELVSTQKANSDGLAVLLYKIERLQQKYKEPDFRNFSVLEYIQYEEVKDIDVPSFRDKFLP